MSLPPTPTSPISRPRPLTRRARWRSDAARGLAAGVLAGFVTGVGIGGAGGRIAMFVLRLTSSSSVTGLMTDDDFTIGRFSGQTGFLLLFTAGLGVLGGLVYLAVRGWIPPRARPAVTGVLAGSAGGALFLRPGGVDFTLLSPLPLAIALFVVLPAGFGVALSLLTERWLGDGSWLRHSPAWGLALLPLTLIALVGPPGLLLLLLLGAGWAVGPLVPPAGVLWRSHPVTVAGRMFLAALGGLALVELTRTATDIL